MTSPSPWHLALLTLTAVLFLSFPSRVSAQASGTIAVLSPLPVGVLLRGQETGNVIIVLGSEQNGQAVDFGNWELALQDVLDILQIESTPSASNPAVLELTAPFLRTTLDTSRLPTRSDIGLAISARKVQEVFSTPLSFDGLSFAIDFEAPEAGASVRQAEDLPPLSVEGLTAFTPPPVTLSSFTQSFRANSPLTFENPLFSGETQLSGGLFGGSYYLRLDEGNLLFPRDWVLDEFRYFLPYENFDGTLGIYDPFWGLDEDFAGLSVTYRQGFKASEDGQGGSNLLPRDIVDEATPGSVVRLFETGRETIVLSEVLVDSTGIYRFEDVPTTDQETRYTVLIYPGGLLSAAPIRRDFSFQSIGGQLPVGTFSITGAAGVERILPDANAGDVAAPVIGLPVIGGYGGLEGGLSLRYGVLEQLTLGAGVVYDDGLRAFGEGFFAPDGVPLDIAVQGTSPVLTSVLGDDDPDVADDFALDGRLDYSPFDFLYFEGVASETLQRFGVRFNPIDELQLRADVDSADLALIGLRVLNYPLWRLQTFADFEINPELEFRWSFSLRDPETGISLAQSGNESGTNTTLAYTVPEVVDEDVFGEGHQIQLNNELRYEDMSLVWNPVYAYTSPLRTATNQPLFGLQLGATFGDTDPRFSANGRVSIVDGLYLDSSYQNFLANSSSQVSLGLTGSYNLVPAGLIPTTRQGGGGAESGVIVSVFFDRNANGTQDSGETLYGENLELLIKLTRVDNTPVQVAANDVVADVTQVRMAPGTYRLDLDPAGYPLNFSPARNSYVVRVSPGVYTTAEIPLEPSFSRIGVLSDPNGNPIVGARVEAVNESGEMVFSITSGAGVYYLDGMTFGTYRLSVLGEPTTPATLTFDEESEPYAELNLTATALGRQE